MSTLGHLVRFVAPLIVCRFFSFESITIPQREDPKHAQLAKRCESARPLGMFRSSEEEFLLCYDGMYSKHPLHLQRSYLGYRIRTVRRQTWGSLPNHGHYRVGRHC